MGKVVVRVRIDNIEDLFAAKRGLIASDQVRFVEVDDALVDTGATRLSMPRRLIERLGLEPKQTRRARTTAGTIDVRTFGTARLTIQGRERPCDVAELPDECPVLVGQVPLELLDFPVDPVKQQLIGNPAHGGEQMLELY